MTPIYTPIKSFIQNFLSLVKFSYRQNDDMSAHNQKHNLLELIMSSSRLFAQYSTLMKFHFHFFLGGGGLESIQPSLDPTLDSRPKHSVVSTVMTLSLTLKSLN